MDTDTLKLVQAEQRHEINEQKKEIRKMSAGARKSKKWSELLFPVYERSVIPY